MPSLHIRRTVAGMGLHPEGLLIFLSCSFDCTHSQPPSDTRGFIDLHYVDKDFACTEDCAVIPSIHSLWTRQLFAMSTIVDREEHEHVRTSPQTPRIEIAVKKQRLSSISSVATGQPPGTNGRLAPHRLSHRSQPSSATETMRRVTNAAKEFYESSMDPLLVPEPLSFGTLGEQTRTVSAPARLQTTKESDIEANKSSHHFPEQPRSTHALMNITAELLVTGGDVTATANLIGLTLEEMAYEMAHFAIGLRDHPAFVQEEIKSYSTSGSHVPVDRRPDFGDEPDFDSTLEDAIGAWTACEDEETLVASESNRKEDDPTEAPGKVIARIYDDPSTAREDEDEQVVYYDALGDPEPEPKQVRQSPPNVEPQDIIHLRRQADLEVAHQRYMDLTRQAQANIAAMQASLQPINVQPVHPTSCITFRMMLILVLASFGGRMVGILLAESQALLLRYDMLSDVVSERITWTLGCAIILAIVALFLSVLPKE